MNEIKTTSLFRHGAYQAVEIPEGFELPGTEVTIRKDGDALVVEAKNAKAKTLKDFFDNLDPVDVDFPDVDAGLLPPKDIDL